MPKFNPALLQLRIQKKSKETLHIFCNAFAYPVLFTLSSLLFFCHACRPEGFCNISFALYFFSQHIFIFKGMRKKQE
jgi:hypothetical protein